MELEELGQAWEGGVKSRAAGGRKPAVLQHCAIKDNTLCAEPCSSSQVQPASCVGRAGACREGICLRAIQGVYMSVCLPTVLGAEDWDPNGPCVETHRPPPKLMCVARTAGREVSPPTTLNDTLNGCCPQHGYWHW